MDKKIASGLPGFGRVGDVGDKGKDGLSVYFTDLDGEINRQTITDRVINGKSLLYKLEDVSNNRPYMKGDVIVDINSNTYEIILSPGNAYKSLGYKYIPSNIFENAQYTNSFTYDKYTNVYMGDSKFLVDDIMSSTFSALEYTKPVYDGLVLGDFNKVNYVDLSTGNNGGIYLHEVFCNSATNENATMAIVSEPPKIGSDNITFRIGNVKSIDIKNGKNVYNPFDTSLAFDFKKLILPKETYVLDNNGNECKVLTEAEYNPNIFRKYIQAMYSPDNHLKVYLNVTQTEGLYDMEIASYNILDFFEKDTFKDTDINDDTLRIKNLRVNVILSRKIGVGSNAPVLSLNDNNNLTIFDAPYKVGESNKINVRDLQGSTWQIAFEIIDEVTGWSRLSESMDIDVSSSMLEIYPKYINSTLEDKTFNLNVRTIDNSGERVILSDYLVDVKSLNSVDKRLNIITPILAEDGEIVIECSVVQNKDKIYEIRTNKTDLTANKYLMFHLGYETVHQPDFVYLETAFNMISSVTVGGTTYDIGRPRSLSYSTEIPNEYGDNTTLIFNNYHKVQKDIHTKRLNVIVFNNSKLEMKSPIKFMYNYSDSDMENVFDDNFAFVNQVSNQSNGEIIGLFSESMSYEIRVPKSKRFIYLLANDLTSVVTDLPDYDDKVGNNPKAIEYDKEVYRFLPKSSYVIANPYYTYNGEDIKTIYITLTDNEFTTSDGYLPYANRDYWGKISNDGNNNKIGPLLINVAVSESVSIQPFKVGFDNFYIKGRADYSDTNNVCLVFDGGLQCGSFGMLNIDKSLINNAVVPNKWLIDSTPFAFNGACKPSVNIYMNSPMTPYNYTASYEVYNYDKIINGFFDFTKNKVNADKIGFSQKIFRPVKNSSLFSFVSDYYNYKSPSFYYENTAEFFINEEVMYFNDRTDRYSYNYTLPQTNTNMDAVELYDYVDVDLQTSFIPTNSVNGKFVIHSNDSNSRVKLTLLFEYSYIDEHNGVVGNKRVILGSQYHNFNSFRQIEVSSPITKPIEFNVNKRIQISSDNLKKTTFTYRFVVKLETEIAYKTKWVSEGGGGNFDDSLVIGSMQYMAAYEHDFRLKFGPLVHNLAYYGKRSESEPHERYIDAKHKTIMLEYIK
ncbi:MAG: hypothetical protein ACRDD8_15065 [Bacteroidales bacterium]